MTNPKGRSGPGAARPGGGERAGGEHTAGTERAGGSGPADTESGQSWQDAAGEFAGALDLLLTDGALGALRRFRPDGSVLRLATSLAARPELLAGRAASLGAELTRIAAGSSEVAPDRRDRRFADPAWSQNPLLRRAVQAYLTLAQAATDTLASAELDWRDDERLKFVLTNVIAAAAPSNNPLLNPAGLKAALDTGGLSVVHGIRALIRDMAEAPRVPAMVEEDAFTVGQDLAVTKGFVVFRTEMFELIQYLPTTEMVHEYPLLIVPPMINKYYITDLAPGRSMIEYLVSQGHSVYAISWRNPDASDSDWDLDSYGKAVVEAFDTALKVSKAVKGSICALCSGGIVSAMVAAHLGEAGQLGRLASLCLGVTVLDQAKAGTAGAMIDEATATAAIAVSRARGYLDGRTLAEVFAWLRPDDLIWNYWVNNYLQGKAPPPFDILYWNADTTRLPAALHRDFIKLALGNALTKPGAATMLGTPVDLSKVDTDAYVIAGLADHLCPWQSCYRSTQLLGGETTFILSTSGHIASMVNPPTNPKSSFQTALAENGNPADPRAWLGAAETIAGSWWPHYSAWLAARSGPGRKSRVGPGRKAFPVLAEAPGTYVHER